MSAPDISELKAYLDEVLAKTKATRLIQVARTIPIPSQQLPGQFEYVKWGFFEETPLGKNRLDFAHELAADLNVLIGEAKAAHLHKTPNLPNTPATPNGQVTPPTSKPEPALEWISSKNNPTVEFIPTDRPGVQYFHELAKLREKGYWLNQDGTLIFRHKKATAK